MERRDGMRPVVVGVDGSEHALRAVRWGAAEAARRRVPLRLVSAFAWSGPQGAGHPDLRDRYRELLLEHAETALGVAARCARQEAPGIEVDHQLLAGPPGSVLRSESRRAELVAVGDRGRTRLAGLLAGSVATDLAGHAVCPVVVVRGPERDRAAAAGQPVAVGVAGPESDAAIRFAFEEAQARAVPLLAVHAWWVPVLDPAVAPLLDHDATEADARELLDEQLDPWVDKHPDVPVERVVVPGHAAVELTTRSAAAQLVVAGSRGRGALAGLLLGSVGNALVHRAECPVALVRTVEGGDRDAS
jgi:nucleotide-binding universal stress UspA family protein